MRTKPSYWMTGVILALGATTFAQDQLLWDNATITTSNGHAHSPPAFPAIRHADDFVVADEAWIVTRFITDNIHDTLWIPSGVCEVFEWRDDGDYPRRDQIDQVWVLPYVATGSSYFGRAEYRWTMRINGLFETGTRWLGYRDPLAQGSGTSYWLEVLNRDSGPDGLTRPGWYNSVSGGPFIYHSGYNAEWQLYGFRANVARPVQFSVTRGARISGGVLSLFESDDDYLIVQARRPSSVSQPSVEVIVEGVAENRTPPVLAFRAEAFATAPAIERIDLFNVVANEWVRLREMQADETDRVLSIVISEGARDYIRQSDGVMRARISYYDPGLTNVGWGAAIDRAVWFLPR